MAVLGFSIYLLVYPSRIILFEAFVWLIESLAFLAIAVAFRIASSKTLAYRARYEILRTEMLASLVMAVIGLGVVVFISYKAVFGERQVTPMILSLYPIGSGAVSFLLEKRLRSRLWSFEIKLESLKIVSDKLRYDVIIELAGGAAILVSNTIAQGLVETGIVLLVGVYVFYGLLGISYHNLLYLIGPGPLSEREAIRRKILRELSRTGYRARMIRVEAYGTFAEAEVWIELDPDKNLADASREASALAKRLVHKIPELLRATIVTVPAAKRTIYRRAREQYSEGSEQG